MATFVRARTAESRAAAESRRQDPVVRAYDHIDAWLARIDTYLGGQDASYRVDERALGILRRLAASYADHRDWRPEWR